MSEPLSATYERWESETRAQAAALPWWKRRRRHALLGLAAAHAFCARSMHALETGTTLPSIQELL